MKRLALTLLAATLGVISLAAQTPDKRLERAIERVEKNDLNGLQRLLKEDSAFVRRDDAGVLAQWKWTLLHRAISDSRSLAIVAAIVEAGAPLDAGDTEGNTPLHFAVKRMGREKLPAKDYDGIIRLLIEKKADINAPNAGGATPLHAAAASRAEPSAIDMLVRAGANVNAKARPDVGGWTPLHGATARNSGNLVALLLKLGADPAATDANGMTPLQVAERGGFADAAKVLRGDK